MILPVRIDGSSVKNEAAAMQTSTSASFPEYGRR